MRISDWSSDVCSSDLSCLARAGGGPHPCRLAVPPASRHRRTRRAALAGGSGGGRDRGCFAPAPASAPRRSPRRARGRPRAGACAGSGDARSEEHTSELQSLMRISYAVFCLKKKKKNELTLKQPTHTPPSLKSYTIHQINILHTNSRNTQN